jgi:hypothetical protein
MIHSRRVRQTDHVAEFTPCDFLPVKPVEDALDGVLVGHCNRHLGLVCVGYKSDALFWCCLCLSCVDPSAIWLRSLSKLWSCLNFIASHSSEAHGPPGTEVLALRDTEIQTALCYRS